MSEVLRVLHVDDDPDFSALMREFLISENEEFEIETAVSPAEGLDRLAETTVHCVVSDYEMPAQDGIEFLKSVRAEYPELPFILFTGKGSEEVASEAISAGATDYLQKSTDTSQFTVLANRITNAITHYRSRRQAQQQHDQYRELFEHAPVMYASVRIEGGEPIIDYCNERFVSQLGYDREAIIGRSAWEFYSDESVQRAKESGLQRALQAEFTQEERILETEDGEEIETLVRATPRHDEQGNVIGLLALFVDISAEYQKAELRERYELVAEASTDAFWDWDPQTDEITRSDPYLTQFGYDAADAAADTDWWRDRIHPDERDRVLAALNEAVTDQHATYDEAYRFRKKDGSYGVLRSRGTVVYDESGEPARMVGAHIDITEQRERERELERYETIVEISGDAVHTLDADGCFTFVNPAFCELVGYSEEELLGESVDRLMDPDDIDRAEELIRRLLADDEEQATMELELQRADGVRVLCEAHVAILPFDEQFRGTTGFLRDISDRKEREEALEQLHAATRELMTADSAHEIARIGSTAAEEILGFTLNGIHLFETEADALVPVAWSTEIEALFDGSPPVIDRHEGLAWRAFQAGEPALHADVSDEAGVLNSDTAVRSELLLPLGDHGLLIASSTTAGEFDRTDKALAGVLAANIEVAFDRVERKEELEEQNNQLERFADIVSHDLRNPLNVAQGQLEIARNDGGEEHLDTVSAAHDRMQDLIEDLRAIAHEGTGITDQSVIDLGEFSEQCWQNVVTDNATLKIETAQRIRANKPRLKQILENLFGNAVEHSEKDVTVTVGELSDGFYVEDDGQGIPPDKRDSVIERGYSTLETGSGLGLSIVARIADAHGWEFTIIESDSDGARIEFHGVTEGD